MHELCINCHKDHEAEVAAKEPYLSRCPTCHRGDFADEVELRRRVGWGVATVNLGGNLGHAFEQKPEQP